MKSFLLGAISACVLAIFTTLTHAVVLPLESRLGGLAYYDPNLDITWAADANINGPDTWDNQVAWAASLDIGGVTGWRLPSADVNGDNIVVDCFFGGVVGCADNEMGYLYWEEGITAATPSPFSNDLDGFWWTSTERLAAPPDVFQPLTFGFLVGFQDDINKDTPNLAWAVHDGNVVPVPAAAWLFGSGLIGLVGIARRRR